MPEKATGTVLTKSDLRRVKSDRLTFTDRPRRPIIVILDRVRQHYNIGALFRLADAFLVERLVVAGSPVDFRNRRFVQAARGTSRWVPWTLVEDAMTAVLQERSKGSQIIVVEQTSQGVPPERFVARFPVCLVLGSERDGISPDIVDVADAAVTIPMLGMANSINVSTAAAIALYRLSVPHNQRSIA